MEKNEENEGIEENEIAISKLNDIINSYLNGKTDSGAEPILYEKFSLLGIEDAGSIQKDFSENKDKLHILGIHILTLEDDGTYTFADNWEENLKGYINSNISIENKEEWEKFINGIKELQQIKTQGKKENLREEKSKEKTLEEEEPELEEEEEEKDEEKKQEQEEKKEEPAKKKNRDLVYLNAKLFKALMPLAKQYGAIAVDKNTNEICGRNKKTGEMEPISGLKKVGNNRANATICGIEKGDHSDLQAKEMWQIGNSDAGFAIVSDGTEKGNIDIKYVIKERGTGANDGFKNYVNLPMLETNGKIGSYQATERTGVRQGLERGENIADVNEEMHEIEEGEELDDLEIQKELEESSNPPPTSKDELKKLLTDILVEEEHMRQVTAEDVAELIIEKNKTLDEAKEIMNTKEENEEYEGYGQARKH